MESIEKSTHPSNTFIRVTFSVLFFMWGLLTVMNFVLIEYLTSLFKHSYSLSTLINLTFFSTYLIVSLRAGSLIKRVGYKKGIIVGWILASAGCFVFFIAIFYKAYQLFLLALFLQAAGITILQVGANLYVVLFGDIKYGASNLTFVQAFNSLGTFLPPLVFAFFEITTSDIHFPYLFLGILMVLFAIFLKMSKIPDIKIEHQQPLNDMPFHPRRHVMHFPQLRLGAFAIFAYVGAEVALGNYLVDFAKDDVKYYWGAAMIGRFIGAFILLKMNPRKAVGYAGSIASFLIIISIFTSGHGQIAFWTITLVGLFNSILFPTIFALGINGLGKFSLDGSAVLIMSIVGGAVIPFMVRNFSQIKGLPPELSQQLAFIIPIICYLYIVLYGLKLSKFNKKEF
jgi:FHS family L-fucose permease-like MFS transporter